MKMNKETFENLKEAFLLEEKENEKAEKTLIHYEHIIDIFIASLEPDQEITKKHVINFKDSLMKIYKPSTISNYIVVVNKFVKYVEIVEENGEFDLDMFKKREKYKLVTKNIKVQQRQSLEEVLEENEYKRLLRVAKKSGQMDMYYIMRILAGTGIRIEELKYFTVENINSNYIEVNNKGKIRKVYLINELKRELNKYCQNNNITQGIIFKGKKDGFMMHQSTIWKRLKKIAGMCRGIKLDKIHAHSFRHLFAIEFLRSGGTLVQLKNILGHSSMDTTAIYAQTTDYMNLKSIEGMYKRKEK